MGISASKKSIAGLVRMMTLLGLVVALLTACGGATVSNAAVVNSSNISMEQYLQLSRLLFEANRLQDTTASTWQLPAGRVTQERAQQTAIQTLIDNQLLKNELSSNSLFKNAKVTLSDVQTKGNQQLDTFFKSVTAQIKPLVTQGIITRDTLRPLAEQNVLQSAMYPLVSVRIAHAKVLTVKTQQQAQDLLQQIQGGTDWLKLAMANSIDPASSVGGDIVSLPRYIFPKEVDNQIFNIPSKPTDITIVKNQAGYSLVQVVSLTDTKLIDLDNTVGVLPNATLSLQAAGVQSYLKDLQAKSTVLINVNWCGDVTGKACPSFRDAFAG